MKTKSYIAHILLVLIMALTFTGCTDAGDTGEEPVKPPVENPKDSKEKPDKEEDDSPKEEDEKENEKEDGEILEEFKILAEKLPTPDVLVKFIDENIEKVSTEDADEMVAALETSLENNKQTYADRIFEIDQDNKLIEIDGDQRDFDPTNIEKIEDEKLKIEVDYLYENMYKLINLEGAFYPIVDYKAMKKYDEYLSGEWKDYIDIRSIDSEDRTMSDGSLNVSFEELLSRITKTEEFLEKYPSSIRKDEMLEEYEYKISAYLNGLPNTPIHEGKSKKIKKEVLASYKAAIEKDNYFSSIVKEHLKNIEENNNIIDESIQRTTYELVSKALENFRTKN